MLRFILFCGFVAILFQAIPEELAFIIIVLVGGIWMYRLNEQKNAFKLDINRLAMLGLLPSALKHAQQQGRLNETEYQRLLNLLTSAQADYYAELPTKQQRLWADQSWALLAELKGISLGIAPWINIPPAATNPPEPKPVKQAQPAMKTKPIAPPAPVTIPPLKTKTEHAAPPNANTRWQRLKTLSYQVLLPFLGQNIGWFLGSFCFIAGAAFLVTNTTGFERALISFTTLASYTLLLLWASYQLRRKREQLATASLVLNIVAVSLMPLTLITASRLYITADSTASLLFSLGLIAIAEYAFFWLLTLASGFIARPLQQALPRWLWLMASLSLAVPIVSLLPAGVGIIGLHLILLALLSRALRQVVQPWIQGNFGTGLNVNHYAAGTLLYTGAVVAIYSCWGQLAELPRGYLGLLLLALAVGLLWLERQLRQHQPQLTALTWLPFVIYGLPVASALLAGFAQANAQPLVVLLTLALALYFYAYMVWLYLSLIPLVLFTVSLACFYGTLVLTIFPALPLQLYALAAAPFWLIITAGLHVLATRPRIYNNTLKQTLYLHFIDGLCLALASLTALSLFNTDLPWVAFASICCTLLLTWQWLRYIPRVYTWQAYYLLALMAALVFSIPNLFGGTSLLQTSVLIFALAISWQSLGLSLYRRQSLLLYFTPTLLINSSLALALFSTCLALQYQSAALFGGALLASSVLIAWLGWTFAQLTLLGLSALGAAFALYLLPIPYYLQLDSGVLLIISAIGWWLMRNTTRLNRPKADRSAAPLCYLWGRALHPLAAPATRLSMLVFLTRIGLLLAWLLGLTWLLFAPFNGTSVTGWWWIYAIVGAGLTISVSVYLRWALLILIPLLLFVFTVVLLLLSLADLPILSTFALAFLLVSAALGYNLEQLHGGQDEAQLWADSVRRLLKRVTFFAQAGLLLGMLATHNYWEYAINWQLAAILLICTLQQLINHVEYRRVRGDNFSIFLACLTLVSIGFSAAQLPAMAILIPSVLVVTLVSLTALWTGLCFIIPAHLSNTVSILAGLGYWLSLGAVFYWSWDHSAVAFWLNTWLYGGLCVWLAVGSNPQSRPFWQGSASLLFLSAVYQSNGLLFPAATLYTLLPWLALQALALAALAHVLSQRQWLATGWTWLLFITAQVCVACYSLLLLDSSYSWILLSSAPARLFGAWDWLVICVVSAASLSIWLYIAHRATPKHANMPVLCSLGWLFILGVYTRGLLFGAVPINLFDTVALTGFVLLAQALQRQFAQPMPRLNLALPLLILFSLPLQTGSWHSSFTLWAIAGLYLTQPRDTAYGTPAYLALLAINLGVYLWAPIWQSNGVGLLQWYCLPAALSVLVMLQLHWVNVRPSVLHRVRLTALSIVYVSAALDVFLQPAFSIFLLALGLSFVGVLAGIGLRVRAYLYAGVVFLVLNVLGQLFYFYAEETLNKAIVLMLVGGLITGLMITLNLYRATLLGYMKHWQIQLQEWE